MNKPVRPIHCDGDICQVPLTRGFFAIIDVMDAEQVGKFNWHALESKGRVYAVRNKPRSAGSGMIWMHRFVAGEPIGRQVDHQDGDSLNNRRANLRPATIAENSRNHRLRKDSTSGLKGVSLHRKTGKWLAQIAVDGAKHYLGLHPTPDAAHTAYVEANSRLHADFGRIA